MLDLKPKDKETEDAIKTIKLMFDYNNAFKRAAKNVINLSKQVIISAPFFRLQNLCNKLQNEIVALANRPEADLAQAVVFQV